MGTESWGRWGPGDERGALNHAGRAQVMRAASLIRSGRVLSLGQPLSRTTPVPSHRARLAHFMDRDGGDYAAGAKRPGGFQFADDTVLMPLHFGTHIDALCHAWHDDQLYNGYPSDTIRSTTGARHCGADKLGAIVTRGVLLDVVAVAGAPLALGATVSRAMLQAAAAASRVDIETGDVVLIRTGWFETMSGDAGYFDGEPGIDVDAARWLAERDVAVIGADNFAVEVIPFASDSVFPVHQCLIRGFGVPLLEGLVLKPLADAGAAEFLFVAAPLPIQGGTGSPITPVAVL